MFIVGSPRWERFHVCRKIAIMSYETPTANYGIPTNANIPVPLAPSLSKMEPEQVRRLAMFQAMRWLEQQQPECPRIGFSHTVRDEKFRIRQTPAMSFAPTAIETWNDRGDGIPEIAQRSFGLLGPSGPLPAHSDFTRSSPGLLMVSMPLQIVVAPAPAVRIRLTTNGAG